MKSVRDIHDAITLGLRNLGTNVFGVYDSYAIDTHINSVVGQILHEFQTATLDETTTLSAPAFQSVRQNAQFLSRFIETCKVDLIHHDGRFYINVPNDFDSNDTARLYNNVRYVVYTNGTTHYSAFGFKDDYNVHDEFVCRIPDKVINSLVNTGIYRIKSIDTYPNYTVIGAPSGYTVGTVFEYNGAVPTVGTFTNYDAVEVIAEPIPSVGTTVLKASSSINYKAYLTSQAYVSYKHEISNGPLPPYRYFLLSGTALGVPTRDVIFTFDAPYTIPTGNKYQELKAMPTTLKSKEAADKFVGRYGAGSDKAVVALEKDRIYYTMNVHRPYRIVLSYIREVIPIDYYIPYVVDFDQNMIEYLVERTIKYIAAVNNNPNYQYINAENK